MISAAALKIDDASSLKWAVDYPLTFEDARPVFSIRIDSGVPPAWLGPVIERVIELARFEDPRGARALDLYDVQGALDFLARVMRDDTLVPWIGRLASGGLQLSWRAGDVEVEAIFDRTRNERELLVAAGDNESDAPIAQAESLFAAVADRLTTSHLEYVGSV